MRDRYVLQVLLVTAGFGLLLGVVGVIDTHNDWSQPVCDKMAKPAEAALRLADLEADCNLPFRVRAEETQLPAKQDCEKTDSSPRGVRSE